MNLAVHRTGDVTYVKGNDDYRGTSIEDALAQRGAWFVILRARDAMWRDNLWPIELRLEVSRLMCKLCNQVPHSDGKRR